MLAGLLGLLLWVAASPARSDLIPSPYLPLDLATQFPFFNGALGGSPCDETTGSYDAETFIWTQSESCGDPPENVGLFILSRHSGEGTRFTDVVYEASLAGLVNNSGALIGGTFALFGIVPELGISDLTLLASGPLFDVDYGTLACAPGRVCESGDMRVLIELDFIIQPLSGLGPFVYWDTNGVIQPQWLDGLEWQVSFNGILNFTSPTFFFYDRKVILSEPGTLALLGIGLFGLGLARRRKR